jgi:uncharacterized membrane protein (DUF485 family)
MHLAMSRRAPPHPRASPAVRRSESEWLAIAESPDFRALVARKRRFLLSCWILVASSYFALPLGAALAPEWFARPVLGEANAGLLLALAEVVLVLLVAMRYVWRAGRDFDRHAAALARKFRPKLGE